MDDQPLSLSELETFIDRYEIDVSDNTACKQQQQQQQIPVVDTDRRYVHVDTPTEPRGEKREANSLIVIIKQHITSKGIMLLLVIHH